MKKNYNKYLNKKIKEGKSKDDVIMDLKKLENDDFYKLLENDNYDNKYDEKDDEQDNEENAITQIHKINHRIRNELLSSTFYQKYMKRILIEKILFENKSLIDRENKGKIKYLQDKFLYDCTPDSIYNWWIYKKNKYGDDSGMWQYDLKKNELLYIIINQILRIINSYIIYDNKDKDKNIKEVRLYFNKLDEIIINDSIVFNDFIELYFLYLDWYKAHIGDHHCDSNIKYFKSLYHQTRKKTIVLLPLSSPPNIRKYNILYSAPIIPFIGVSYITHNHHKHPCWHINHDLKIHGDYIKNIYMNIKKERIIEYFEIFKEIITEIIKLDETINIIFFDLLHENGIEYLRRYINEEPIVFENFNDFFNNIINVIDAVEKNKEFIHISPDLYAIFQHDRYIYNNLYKTNNISSIDMNKYRDCLNIIKNIICEKIKDKTNDQKFFYKKYIKYKHKYLNIK